MEIYFKRNETIDPSKNILTLQKTIFFIYFLLYFFNLFFKLKIVIKYN